MIYQKLIAEFNEIFGKGGEIRLFRAPGRVNMIGEHIDYNGGVVLPAALDMAAVVAVRKRADNLVRVAATDLKDITEIDLMNTGAYKQIPWGNYQAGVFDVMREAGFTLVGCDMLYDVMLPIKAGLSSSAAIEVVTAVVINAFSGEAGGRTAKNGVELALLSQKAENDYVGVNCGIMDQYASTMGRAGHAMLIDCSTLVCEYIPVKLNGYTIVIANTNKPRSLIDSKFNERCSECAKAVEMMRHGQSGLSGKSGLQKLCSLTPDEFEKLAGLITDKNVEKRARHVVYENARVYKAAEALRKGDAEGFGKLLEQSHLSLQNDYEVSGKELDSLVAAAMASGACIGARMTGAGFGGCTINVVENGKVDSFTAYTGKEYEKSTGYNASFYASEISDGASEINV